MRTMWSTLLLLGACSGAVEVPDEPAEEAVETAPVPIQPSLVQSVSATSSLEYKGVQYGPRLAFDGDSKTAWCEGANGLVGESITVQLKKSVPLVGIDIQGGFFKDDRTLINNGRVRTMTVTADSGWSDTVVFDFVPERQHRAPTVHVRNTPVSNVSAARELTFSIDEADAGQFSKDVCVSEIILRVAP